MIDIVAGSDDFLFDPNLARQREALRHAALLSDDLLHAGYSYDPLRVKTRQVSIPG